MISKNDSEYILFHAEQNKKLEKKLSKQQLEQGQQMARTCVAKNYKNCV